MIKIWREMMVDVDWLQHLQKQGKHIGIYWSHDKLVAESHWGYNKGKSVKVLIESSVKEDYVNWDKTIKANILPSTGEENEIILFRGTPLKIERLWINEEEQDIKLLQHKIFIA